MPVECRFGPPGRQRPEDAEPKYCQDQRGLAVTPGKGHQELLVLPTTTGPRPGPRGGLRPSRDLHQRQSI